MRKVKVIINIEHKKVWSLFTLMDFTPLQYCRDFLYILENIQSICT